MSYIGSRPLPGNLSVPVIKQDITGTGATSYGLNYTVSSVYDIEVFINNVRQEPIVAYTIGVTSGTIEFTEVVNADDDVYILFRAVAQKTQNIPVASVQEIGGIKKATATDITNGTADLYADIPAMKTYTEDYVQNLPGRRNLIINGDMRIAQRGTSQTGPAGVFKWVADRFWIYAPSSTGTFEQSTDAPNQFTYSLYNNTDGTMSFGTNVELPFSGNAGIFTIGIQLTLSFYIKSPTVVNGFISPSFRNTAQGVNSIATSSPVEWAYSDINTWQRVVVPLTIEVSPNAGNLAFQVESAIPAGAKITGVQLELGSVATPFEHRSYGEELALCQRYYWEITSAAGIAVEGYTDLSTYIREFFFHPVEMRVAPTVSGSLNGVSTNIRSGDTTTLAVVNPFMSRINFRGATLGRAYAYGDITDKFTFDAEL